VKRLQSEPREVLGEVLKTRLMAHSGMGIRTPGRRLCGVLATLTMHMILMLRLVVVRLEILIGDRP
jgi:hypothetical protein